MRAGTGGAETGFGDIAERMERMYRPQQLIYDLTRKYYLLGRDELIRGLDLRPGQRLLDVGCGTGRNLAAVARRYPGAGLAGIDAAEVMLATTRRRFVKAGLAAPALARLPAEALVRGSVPGITQVDRVIFSYSLSMMDDPARALAQAASLLAPDGRIAVVDFGRMDGLPRPAAALLRAWLARFGVHHRPQVWATLRQLAQEHGATTARRRLAGGYAELLHLQMP